MAETNRTDFPREVTLDPDDAGQDTADPTPQPQDPPKPLWRTFARAIWMLLLTGLVLAGGYIGQKQLIAAREDPPKRPAREKVAIVETAPVAFGDYKPMLRLFGETVAGRRVELRALVAGEVKAVGDGLRDGGEVDAGDLLLEINPFNYEGALIEARAALAEARGRLDELNATMRAEKDAMKRDREQRAIAEKDAKTTRALVARNAVSGRLLDERELTLSQRRQTVEQRENNVKVQIARIEQQKATIDRLTWAESQAGRRLTETRLSAPFNAYVSDVNADVGRLLGASDRVATLFDRDWIEARFVLTDSQYGRIVAAAADEAQELVGRPVKVIWGVGPTPITYDAIIVRIGATIAAGQGGVTVIARLKTPTAPIAIRPGAFVEIEVADRRYRDVARLPQTAVYDGRTIYVVKDGRLEARAVDVVGVDGTFVLLQGEKIAEGDRVVTTRISTIGSGLKVEEL